jgi:hypothetical protein
MMVMMSGLYSGGSGHLLLLLLLLQLLQAGQLAQLAVQLKGGRWPWQ